MATIHKGSGKEFREHLFIWASLHLGTFDDVLIVRACAGRLNHVFMKSQQQ